MSYHVNVRFEPDKAKPPWMEASDILKVLETSDYLPESNFIQEASGEAKKLLASRQTCSHCKVQNEMDAKFCKKCGAGLQPFRAPLRVPLKKLWWSGNHATESLEGVAKHVQGRLEAFFVGEDGNVFGGAIIEDGKYTPCHVEMKLVPK